MVSWPEPVLMVSVTTSALSSSSSLSEPPEELLSEATSGAFLVTQTFQTQGEAALTEKSKQLALHNEHNLRNHAAARPRRLPWCKQSAHSYCEFWDKGFCADPALTAHNIIFVRKKDNRHQCFPSRKSCHLMSEFSTHCRADYFLHLLQAHKRWWLRGGLGQSLGPQLTAA